MASKKQQTMLAEGAAAPNFKLRDLNGIERTRVEIASGRAVLLAFFKAACPTCQFAMPFLERLYRNGSGIGIYAISQDDAETTREFHREFGITMPTLLDSEDEGYPASNAYGLTNVPSLFLVEPDGKVSMAFMGFDKRGMEALGRRVGAAPFEEGEYVPEWKSG